MTTKTCPQCGGEVDHLLTCHTYSQRLEDGTERWMSCLPCDSATDWYCLSEDCDWDWTCGLNPRNPRAEENATHAPPWAAEADYSYVPPPSIIKLRTVVRRKSDSPIRIAVEPTEPWRDGGEPIRMVDE